MNREVDLGSHSLFPSSPVPNIPNGLSGRKAPLKEKVICLLPPTLTPYFPNKPHVVTVDVKPNQPKDVRENIQISCFSLFCFCLFVLLLFLISNSHEGQISSKHESHETIRKSQIQVSMTCQSLKRALGKI